MMRTLILILVTAAGWCSATEAVEVKYWDRLPLAIPLTAVSYTHLTLPTTPYV